MSEMQLKRLNNRGSFIIEISIIIPLIIMIIMMFVFCFVNLTDREKARANLYSAIYTVPPDETVDMENITTEINRVMIFGEAKVMQNSLSREKILIICNINSRGYTGNEIECGTEKNICTDRLRRWQMYENIREEYWPE